MPFAVGHTGLPVPLVSCRMGQAVLYVRLQKELYRCLKSALLFYEKLVGYLEAYGFKINPYDTCVENTMVGRKQLTVCWHVDDPQNHAWTRKKCQR